MGSVGQASISRAVRSGGAPEHEKTGYEHVTPLTTEAVVALEVARRMGAGTGDAPVLPLVE